MNLSRNAHGAASDAEPWMVASGWRRLLLVLAATAVVVALRGALDPMLGDRLPYALFAVASIAVTWIAGAGAGASLLVAGYLVSNVLWVDPRGVLALFKSSADFAQTLLYFLSGGLLVAYIQRARRIQGRAALTAHERELERQARAASEQRFRKLAEAVDDAFYVADPESGRVLYLSPAFERIWGISIADVLNDARVWASSIHPDDLALTEGALARARSAGSYASTHRILRPDGSVRWVRDRASVMDDGLVAGIATDVTDEMASELSRRAREERLRVSEASLQTAMDLVGMATWIVDLRTGETTWSERHFHLLGLDPEHAVAGIDTWLSRVHPDDRARVADAWRAAEADGGLFRETYRVVWPDGHTVRWVEARGGFLRDDAGHPIVGTGAFHDVTERKHAQATRERLLENAERLRVEAEVARAEAEDASMAKDNFLATLSHELRSPLQGMVGWLTLLRGGHLDPPRTERALDAIERSVRLQAQLVSDLLDVSRIVAGKLQLALGVVDLSAVVEGVVEEMRPIARKSEVALRTTSDGRMSVAGDAERLHQIVANLLSNALKFTPPGGVVEVRCERRDGEVAVVVEDSGEGIAADKLPRIFERFAQADSSPTRRHGGLGLGLAIVKHLTEAHGGGVEARSAGVGRGASFTVTLPAARAADVPPARSSGSPSAERAALGGVDVLLVEDDDSSRESLALILEDSGARVVQAGSAAAALAAFHEHRPGIVISDLGLGPVDGYRLLARIRATEKGRSVPAIALTGFASSQDRVRVLAAGFQAHLPKPAHPEELVATVLRTLEGALSTSASDA